MSNNKRNREGRFASKGMTGPIRDNPWTSAAIAAGAAGLGAFLWSKRNQLGEQISSWREELMAQNPDAEAAGDSEPFVAKPSARRSSRKTQAQIAEEALTLKETGEPAPTGL